MPKIKVDKEFKCAPDGNNVQVVAPGVYDSAELHPMCIKHGAAVGAIARVPSGVLEPDETKSEGDKGEGDKAND